MIDNDNEWLEGARSLSGFETEDRIRDFFLDLGISLDNEQLEKIISFFNILFSEILD